MKKPTFVILTFLVLQSLSAASSQPEEDLRFHLPQSLTVGSVAEILVWSKTELGSFVVLLKNAKDGTILTTRTFPFLVPDKFQSFGGLSVQTALIALDALTSPQTIFLVIKDSLGVEKKRVSLTVQPRTFRVEIIPLNKAMTALRETQDSVEKAEAEQIWKIYLTHDDSAFFQTGRWNLPFSFEPRRSALFGDTRAYKYVDGSTDATYHSGYDFAVPRGTPVLASGAGRVVLARFRKLTGGTIVIEHLPGLYGDYFHMDRLLVKEGDVVGQGDRIGSSGATGLVTGPHLHWEFRLNGVSVDGQDFLSQGILDRDRVLDIISTAERQRG